MLSLPINSNAGQDVENAFLIMGGGENLAVDEYPHDFQKLWFTFVHSKSNRYVRQ